MLTIHSYNDRQCMRNNLQLRSDSLNLARDERTLAGVRGAGRRGRRSRDGRGRHSRDTKFLLSVSWESLCQHWQPAQDRVQDGKHRERSHVGRKERARLAGEADSEDATNSVPEGSEESGDVAIRELQF